ncbi:MAG: hypothetical protein AUH43_26525 [Acidobacteria bacterium 13_1_40CM_65_14]|jgi:hypothetical protein|nr:MAG: hypothetical protein AUH43_26525 [Acidobacteria bacterium 13_1_40CM_65_14]OLD16452.1 MAG: hypothetical protein AUJ01_10500 [Acidobacteria bacterium 13_1_40CM_3_65_5]
MATVLAIPATRAATFAAMSAALTGFKPDFIAPPVDPNQLHAHLLHHIDELAGTTSVDQLLAQFTVLQAHGQTSQQIADVMLGISPSSHAPAAQLAQSIVKLWYLGSWYPPGSTSAFDGNVVSSQAYVGGLAWRAMQAHAMGDSPFKFGDWTSAPPSLAEFGADVPEHKS